MQNVRLDEHDILAAERFLAAEARLAAAFEHVEATIAPILRGMRATGRTTYLTDPERGAIWGHAFLRPPYAPSIEAEWFIAWGIRFPDGGSGWEGADPPLPRTPHLIVAVGGGDAAAGRAGSPPQPARPAGWSAVEGEAAFLAAAMPLHQVAFGSDAFVPAMATWMSAQVEELRSFLPEFAAR